MTVGTQLPVVPSQAQRFKLDLNGTIYSFRLTYNDAQDGCWILDIGDENGGVLVAGISLVSGVDLLDQHRHLGFPGSLVVTTDRGAGEVPTFDGLGVTSHLFFIPDPAA
ncbi:phage baseplate plug protein [Methylobacterium sp. SI9]|uniref:phage baseplate plug family protein n=1 Tax=Methylobacterium guangdongense TaxID=3138811 RepID=UPI00313AC0A2